MLTRTTEYALRAMIYLAQHSDSGLVPGNRIATHTRIPHKYLSKILGDLVRARVLEAAPGKSGGFRMARSPSGIRLFEVLAPFEPVLADQRACPFGNDACNDDNPCVGHERWKHVREAFSKFLNETSVHDIAFKAERHRKRTKKGA